MNKKMAVWLAGALLLCSASIANAQSLIRGPYLQKATFDGITICWRTDSAVASHVRYGTSQGSLGQSFTDPTPKTEHRVELAGLQAYTDYYYAVGTPATDFAGDDSLHQFRILPPVGSTPPVRIWAIGDFGKDNVEKNMVRDAYVDEANATGKADVWLWLGDNAYNDGTDAEYQQKVFHNSNGFAPVFPNTVFWPTPGNHDYNSVNLFAPPPQHTGPYYDIVEVPANGECGGLASGYELYYSFDYGNVHFLSLNSELTTWTSSSTSQLADWIRDDLAQNTLPWVVAYFHQPPHSKGSHDSDDFWEIPMSFMRNTMMPILETGGVDLILAGHSHVYERSYLVDGFFGNSWDFDPNQHAVSYTSGYDVLGEAYLKPLDGPDAKKGSIYSVVGNSGSMVSSPSLNHPMMYYGYGCDTCIGSLVIDVLGNRLDAFYLTGYGEKLDAFTIIKAPAADVDRIQETVTDLRIYPNPTESQVEVGFSTRKRGRAFLDCFDVQGRHLQRMSLGRLGAGEHKKTFSLEGRPDGVYVLRISVKDDFAQARVVKRD